MKALAVLALVVSSMTSAMAAVVDQQQTTFNAGISGRIFYTYFQTFVAGSTGTLTAVDIGLFNSGGTMRCEVWKGYPSAANGGMLLGASTAVIPKPATPFSWNQFAVSIPITAGTTYSINIVPVGMPDPFGLCAGYPAPYGPGQSGFVQGNTAYPNYLGPFSLTFRTWVTP